MNRCSLASINFHKRRFFSFDRNWTRNNLFIGIFVFFIDLKFWKTWVLFVGLLIPLFWTSGDVYSGFQSQSGHPYSSLAEVFVLHVHLWCDTCWPLGGQQGSRAISSTYLQGIGGTQNRELSCRRSQCELSQARRSTDWAIPARLFIGKYCKKAINLF